MPTRASQPTPQEVRLYRVVWAVGFATWLGCFAAWVVTTQTTPWLWLGLGGGVLALWFGCALRYEYSVWPFHRLVADRDQKRE
jgi:uncharacterized membrane protein YccC